MLLSVCDIDASIYFPLIMSCLVFILSPLGALSAHQLVRRGRHERRRARGDQTVLLLLSTLQQGQRCSITLIFSRPLPSSHSLTRDTLASFSQTPREGEMTKGRLKNMPHFLLRHFFNHSSVTFSFLIAIISPSLSLSVFP